VASLHCAVMDHEVMREISAAMGILVDQQLELFRHPMNAQFPGREEIEVYTQTTSCMKFPSDYYSIDYENAHGDTQSMHSLQKLRNSARSLH